MPFQFEYPYVFIVFILFLLLNKLFPLKEKALIIPHIDNLMSKSSIFSLEFLLKWIFLISLILATSSPYISNGIVVKENKGYNIGLILDSSLSMKERGFNSNNIRENKFDIVQNIVAKFIKNRKNDNISIVVFGEFAFVALPLSFDKAMSIDILNTLSIGMAGKRTAIADGLAQSIKTLSSSKAEKNIAILLTDGQNTAGEIPIKIAVKLAKKYNVKVYTIGIGKERLGNRKGIADFDVAYLQYIANETGGKFFSSSNQRTLKQIYEEINKLEKHKIKSNTYEKKTYYFYYPLFLAIIALYLYILVGSSKNL